MDNDTDDSLAYLTDQEYLTLNQLVGRAYDQFWSQNELTYDKHLNVVRSDRPRVRPTTWFGFIGMHEEEKLNAQLK